ncbi:MAG: hypothetical protein NTZ05_00485 [Chloroflexi bacterium]|nr:hypothetical protein [Chloroflexota bacterium]
MNCGHIREQLHLSLDGAPADAALREHLAACRACCDELASLRQSMTTLSVLPRVAAPRDLLAGIMNAVREQPLPDPRRHAQRRLLSAMAAALAAVGMLLLTVAAGDVWRILNPAPTASASAAAVAAGDDADLIADDAAAGSVLDTLQDPVLLAEQLPAAAEHGGAAFVVGLCLLFVAAAAALLSLLLPVQRPAPTAGRARPSPLHML